MKLYKDSILLISSFLIVFLWQNSQFAEYSVPFVGFLIFLFLLVSIKNKANINLGGPINFFILNTIILLFIFSTGGLTSSLFFLLYFLLFAAAFILDPRTVLFITPAVIVIFWSQIFQGDVTGNITKLAPLAILSPLAFFFGLQFIKNDKKDDEALKAKERSVSSADVIASDVGQVIESGKNKLNNDEIKKLNEVLEEAEDLRNEKKES